MASPPTPGPPPGPPYEPGRAVLGGTPTPGVDDPICGVITLLFTIAAILNMTILQINLRRNHKFLLSGLLFGFSTARIIANVLRIAWASFPHDVRLIIAAQIFTNAGVIALFAANLVLTQRILRAYHPHIGWDSRVTLCLRALAASLLATLIMLVVVVVMAFYTLDLDRLTKIHNVQIFCSAWFVFIAAVPIFIVPYCLTKPRRGEIEKFGKGRMRHKLFLLMWSSILLTFGASWRLAAILVSRPANQPHYVHSKAALYCVDFAIELICVFSYALSRFDLLFHIPDGSSGPGHYVNGGPRGTEKSGGNGDSNGSSSEGETGLRGYQDKHSDGERSTDVSVNNMLVQRTDSKDLP